MARVLASVISGLSTGLLFLALSINPNPQTRRGHSQLLCKQRRNKRNLNLFLMTLQLKMGAPVPS